MKQQLPYQNWLSNPERRVGRVQLLRATYAAVGAQDPAQHERKAQLHPEVERRVRKSPRH